MSFGHYVGTLNEWVGKIFAWLIVILVLEIVYAVVARYVFNAPVVWHFDLTYMLYGGIWMLGCPYAVLHKRQVRIDILFERLTARKQSIVEIVGYVVLFFPLTIMLFYTGLNRALYALSVGEVFKYTAWVPIAFPFRMVLPVAMFLLLLQGIAEFISTVHSLKKS